MKFEKKIKMLMDVIGDLPVKQSEMVIDRMLDRLLTADPAASQKEAAHLKKQLVSSMNQGSHLRKASGNQVTARSSGSAEDFVARKLKELSDSGAITAEEERQQQLSASRQPGKSDYDQGLECLVITENQGFSTQKLKALHKIASSALEIGDGRPLPATVAFNSYNPVRHHGPAPAEVSINYLNNMYTLTPPISLKKMTAGQYGVWLAWEHLLNNVKDFEVKVSDKELHAKQHLMTFDDRMIAAKVRWHELSPKSPDDGIATISAESAREILRKSTPNKKHSKDFINLAPASWMSVNGRFSKEFSVFLKDGLLGLAPFNRVMRFAMSRLLMVPIGEIEKKLFSIAFLEFCDIEPGKISEVQNRGRGRPRKFLTSELLEAGISDPLQINKKEPKRKVGHKPSGKKPPKKKTVSKGGKAKTVKSKSSMKKSA